MDMSHPPLQDDHSSVHLEPEEYEFLTGPDQAARDRAIAAFLERLEVQEQDSYTGLGDVLSRLPLPTTVTDSGPALAFSPQCNGSRHAAEHG
jgi:hypothetical protein